MTITVLHLIKGLGPGGAENLLVNQARVAEHTDVRYLAAHLVPWKSHLVPALEGEGMKVTCLDAAEAKDPRWLPRLRELIVSEGVDIVHGHSPLVAAQSRMLLRSIPKADRPKSVYTEHNEWGRHHKNTRRLNKSTLRFEDHVFAVSEAVKTSMETRKDVEVLRHGIDVDTVRELRWQQATVRDELDIEPRQVVFGTVANFRKEKGYEIMLEAARLAIDEDPDIRFVTVGQGPLIDKIIDMREDYDLVDEFDMLGYRDDATRIMAGFDVFTLSSHHEGLPVSLMDALALGLPVVATDVGGIREATTPDIARLVPRGDAKALAEQYVAAADDERWRMDAGEAALAQSDNFDIRAALGVLESTYARLAS